MKKRRILALILASATLFSLVGCGNEATTNGSNTTVESQGVSETETKLESDVDQNAWKSGKFTLHGTELQIGVSTFRELTDIVTSKTFIIDGEEKRGWVDDDIDADLNVHPEWLIIQPNGKSHDEIAFGYLAATRDPIGYVRLYNPTSETIDVLDGRIEYFEIEYRTSYVLLNILENGESEKLVDLVLPNGVTFGTPEYELYELYGEPTRYGDEYFPVYDCGDFKIVFDVTTGFVSTIRIIINDSFDWTSVQ